MTQNNPTQQFDDEDIQTALDDYGIDASVDEARDVLDTVQTSFGEIWDAHMDAVEDNGMELVAMKGDILVFADHTGQYWNEEFGNAPLAEQDLHPDMQLAVSQLHHQWAREITDYSWSVDDPVVVRAPDSFDAGKRLVEAVVISLVDRGATPREAWAVWGVLSGNSRNNWAARMGYDSHSGVSNAVRDAKEKVPIPYV